MPKLARLPQRIATLNTARVASVTSDQGRGSATSRGYDRTWRKLRLAKLAADPLCECDDCQAGKVRVTLAEVVDHIKTIAERPDLRLVWSNLRSMAKRCHDRHTAKTQGFARSGNP